MGLPALFATLSCCTPYMFETEDHINRIAEPKPDTANTVP